jgi:hypothetical protein
VLRQGDPPVRLEERGIRPLVHQLRRPALVAFAGACDPGRRTPHRPIYYEDVPGMGDAPGGGSPSRLLQEEALLPTRAVDRDLAALTAGGTAALAPDPDGRDRTVQLDFGGETSGLAVIALEAPAGTNAVNFSLPSFPPCSSTRPRPLCIHA